MTVVRIVLSLSIDKAAASAMLKPCLKHGKFLCKVGKALSSSYPFKDFKYFTMLIYILSPIFSSNEYHVMNAKKLNVYFTYQS